MLNCVLHFFLQSESNEIRFAWAMHECWGISVSRNMCNQWNLNKKKREEWIGVFTNKKGMAHKWQMRWGNQIIRIIQIKTHNTVQQEITGTFYHPLDNQSPNGSIQPQMNDHQPEFWPLLLQHVVSLSPYAWQARGKMLLHKMCEHVLYTVVIMTCQRVVHHENLNSWFTCKITSNPERPKKQRCDDW